jgi:hypothetical protein
MLRLIAAAALLLAAVGARAAVTLVDFETQTDLSIWHDEGAAGIGGGKSLERAARFATSGTYSLRFRTPKWKAGMPEWPAFEARPPIADWSGFDRLVFDVTNATAIDQKLCLFLSDEKHATRDGLITELHLSPNSYEQAVIPLAKLGGQGLDPSHMRVMHIFTERPPGDMEVYLSTFSLLRPGEPLPAPQPGFVKELAGLLSNEIASLAAVQRQAGVRVAAAARRHPEIEEWGERLLGKWGERYVRFAEQVERGDPAVLRARDIVASLRESAERITAVVGLRARFESVRADTAVRRSGRSDVVVGFATSMEKVLPRGPAPSLNVTRRASLSLARSERQALQVIVMPCERAARKVSVRVGDLVTAGGARFDARNIASPPVGYVRTRAVPPYGSSYVGWWPDPILEFMREVDVAQGDAQAFWIRFHAPKRQPAGLYRGKLEVLIDGRPLYRFDLAVRVYPFTLPERSPLNMAITFVPSYFEPNGSGGWQEGLYRDSAWHNHKLQWADFLADHYITYDSLYSFKGWSPDFEVLQRLQREGRLGTFNLGYYSIMPEKEEERTAWEADVVNRIGEPYRKAKELGLLDHAYIYGCDENPKELFPGVQRAAEFLKQRFPGAMVMTTTYDASFGTDSVITSMDAFCPLTPSFNAELAAKARAAGRQVWWYTCCGPHHPYCNTFVEYPAIDGRILMGAQVAKYRPDGYLYYQIGIWNGKPIASGPFTDWDPRSWTNYHGDGSWTCVGPGGMPLATVRLENFRDGLEDYAYVRILEDVIRKFEARPSLTARQQAWLAKARAAVDVPSSVVKSMTEYTRDPATLYAWRCRIGDLIASSGVTDVAPWRKTWALPRSPR